MKKLIAILVVFAMLTTAIFAEANIGGSVGMGALLITGDNTEKVGDAPGIFTELNAHWVGVNFTWENDEGTSGGKIKINGDMNKGVSISDGDANHVKLGGRVWWQPIDMLKITFTNLEDEGVFGRGNAIDWGYQATAAAGNTTALWSAGWNSFSNATIRTGNGFFGGLGGGGQNVLAISLFPIDGLAVNLAWDIGGDSTKDFFKSTLAQVTYNIEGIGQLGLSFKGNDGGYAAMIDYAGPMYAQTIGIDFTLWALSGMNIEIGAKIPVGVKYEHGWWVEAVDLKAPIEIGLGFAMNQWSGEPLHVYARAGVVLPCNFDFKKDMGGWDLVNPLAKFNDIMAFALDINPSYDIGFGRVYFDLGFAMVTQKDKDDSNLFWHFSPYLKTGIGVGDFYVGFAIWNGEGRGGYEALPTLQRIDVDKAGTKRINFAVPIYFEVGF